MSNDFVRRQYNKIAEQYLKQRNSFINNKYLSKFASLFPDGSTVLDIGCGAGVPVDVFLAEHGFHVIGIDISEKQIELAKKNVPEGEFYQKDMSSLLKGEYKVEAVVSFYAIFHTPRETHPDLFKKIHSFLPENGYLLVTMGYSDWVGKENDFFGGEMEWSHYGADKNKEIIKNAGFEIVFDEIDTTGGERHLVVIGKKILTHS